MPLTAAEFRTMALALPGAVERSHMAHPDFRVEGRIFASLTPAGERGMVKVPLELQAELVGRRAAFEPATGAWGRAGCTMVDLAAAAKADVRRALAAAHRRGLSKS